MRMKIEYIPIDLINIANIDENGHQRVTDLRRAKKIADSFNMELFDPLHVSLREDGSYWAWDGGHRLEALRFMGETSVPCFVYPGTAEHEALLFQLAQESRKGLTPLARFKASLCYKDPISHDIQKVCNSYGYTIGGGHNQITCIHEIKVAFNAGVLESILYTLNHCWSDIHRKASLNKNVIGGLRLFYTYHGNNPLFREERLIKKLNDLKSGPGILLGGYNKGVYENLINLYNAPGPGRSKFEPMFAYVPYIEDTCS